MKVKIKDLKPNPFRHIDTYPVNEQKVQVLMDSIKHTGFWDNLLARSVDGEIQIAYGHHRLEALKLVMDPEEEVDIPVKNLDDATMLQIMARENMEHWEVTPAIIDETIKAAKQFLQNHPEIAQKYGHAKKSSAIDENITVGAPIICRFLGWKQQTVTDSIERLRHKERREIEEPTFEGFNTEGSARAFVNVVKKHKKLGTPIPKEKHQVIVKKFRESGNSKKALDEAVKEVLGEKSPEVESQDIKMYATGASEGTVEEKEETTSYLGLVEEFNTAERGFQKVLIKIMEYYGESATIPEECRPHHTSVHAKLITMRNTISSLIERFVRRPDFFKTHEPVMKELSDSISVS